MANIVIFFAGKAVPILVEIEALLERDESLLVKPFLMCQHGQVLSVKLLIHLQKRSSGSLCLVPYNMGDLDASVAQKEIDHEDITMHHQLSSILPS